MRRPGWARPGPLFVLGLVAAGGLVTALGVWLREEMGKVPRDLARSVARLEESGDFARFQVELEELLLANPQFRDAFHDVLPVPPVSFAEPPARPRPVTLLAPLGVVPPAADGALHVRWFAARADTGTARAPSVRLCPEQRTPEHQTSAGQDDPEGRRSLLAGAGAPAPATTPRADETRESAPLPLSGTRRLADGSFVAELASPPAAGPGWMRIRLSDGDATGDDPVEDAGWFRTTEPRDPGRASLGQARYALLRICGQGRMSPSQADLLLALLLEERRFDLAEARLLELLRAEQRSSRASDRLLRAAYGRLGRCEALPREPARREDAADWRGQRNP